MTRLSRPLLSLPLVLALAACGAAGLPKAPNGEMQPGPITLSGDASIGISK